MVVSGEGSGVVGTSYTLSCRVSLPSGVEPDSLDIQWLGLSTPEPVMISTGVYISTVTLDSLPPTTTDYTCRASYTENGVSSGVVEESLTIDVVSKLPSSFQCQRLCGNVCYTVPIDIDVFVVPSISREIGVPFTLTCTVSFSHRVRDSSVSIQWQGPSTDDQPTVERASDDEGVVNELILGPLTLAHGGDYTCTAVYTVDGHTATVRSDVESVVPISELSPQFVTLLHMIISVPPPSVMVRSDDVILVGEDVVVYCDVDLIGVMRESDVTVNVSWFQDSVPVRTDSRVSISGVTGDEDGGHSSLSFSPLHFSDMATYECRVTLTPLLGPATPVSSNASLFLRIGKCATVIVHNHSYVL